MGGEQSIFYHGFNLRPGDYSAEARATAQTALQQICDNVVHVLWADV